MKKSEGYIELSCIALGIILGVCILAIIISLAYAAVESRACHAKGGERVRLTVTFVCARLEILK